MSEGGVLSCVNERLRFLKYTEGNKFERHCDGLFPRKIKDGNLERSVFTMHLYLCDSEEGGATIFYDDDLFESTRGEFRCEAKKGRLAIFRQTNFAHCGERVEKGTKYTVRTDIMYRRLLKDEKLNETCNSCKSEVKVVTCPIEKEPIGKCKCPNTLYGNLNKKYNFHYCIGCFIRK